MDGHHTPGTAIDFILKRTCWIFLYTFIVYFKYYNIILLVLMYSFVLLVWILFIYV